MSVSSMEEDLPPRGKKIILRRLNNAPCNKSLDEIISESATNTKNVTEHKSLDEIINEKIIKTSSKVSASKKKAQANYYKQKHNLEKKPPVHARIGGSVMHEQQTRNGKTFKYRYLDPNSPLQPRLKKLPNGQLMTRSFMQKAQKRLYKLRYFRAMSAMKIQVKNVNSKPKYANIYHSLHDSFDSEIQEMLLHIQKITKVHDVLDPDTPILVETKTSMTLHERFSSYP